METNKCSFFVTHKQTLHHNIYITIIEVLENNGDEGGRRAKHELDLLLQIINNIKPRVTALLLRDCPTKQKIWAVSSKLSLASCFSRLSLVSSKLSTFGLQCCALI